MRIPACVMADLRAQLSAAEENLWTTAWDCQPDCIASLSPLARIPVQSAYALCRKMSMLGWMLLVSDGPKLRPVAVIPPATQEKMARILEEEYAAAPNKSEFVMKRILDLLIHSEDFIDNARLDFLRNTTGELLELDRYYREGVGFEFNGVQHLGPTEKYPDLQAALDLQTRDVRKIWLCEKAGVHLVRLFIGDLHPRIISRLIPGILQRNYVDETGPYYKALCNLCVSHIMRSTQVDIHQIMTGRPAR